MHEFLSGSKRNSLLQTQVVKLLNSNADSKQNKTKMLIHKQSLMMNLLLWIVRAITNLPARINKK